MEKMNEKKCVCVCVCVCVRARTLCIIICTYVYVLIIMHEEETSHIHSFDINNTFSKKFAIIIISSKLNIYINMCITISSFLI